MRLAVHWQILIALGLAVVVGLAVGADGTLFSISFVSVFDFVGTLFLNALKMLIVPLIVSSIICGMASIGSEQGIGRLGSRTVIYYMVTSLIAIMIGLAMVNLTLPGIVDGEPARDLIGLSDAVGEITEKVEGRGASDVIEVFLRMVPTNIVAAAANGQMLGLIFFSLLFGFFMARLKSNPGSGRV